MELIFQYPSWFFIFCIVLGLSYAALLYVKNNTFSYESKHTKKIIAALALARFLSVTIIAFLLLSPFIKKRNIDKVQPVIVLAHDNSESMTLHWNNEDSANYIKQLNTSLEKLGENYTIDYYTFDEKLKNEDTIDFTGKSTNISQALVDLNGIYYNQNVGAVIFASDGIYNTGNNPSYTSFSFPLYTIGLGDTSQQTDAKILNVRSNKLAYLDDKVEVLVNLEAYLLKGETYNVSLSKNKGTEKVALVKEQVPIKQDFDEQELRFTIEAKSVGIHKYNIDIAPFDNEISILNNSFSFYIEVIDNRQKILLVANAPHPDIAAIKSVVEKNKNYELDIQYISKFNATIDKYSLVIAHQLPSTKNAANALLSNVAKFNIPIWYITGAASNYNQLNSNQGIVAIKQKSASLNDATPAYASNFSSFTLSETAQNSIKKFPPLQTPFGDYKLAQNANTFLLQKIGSVVSDFPILAFQDYAGKRSAILIGDGLWRWKIHDYYENGSTAAFDEIIEKTINYLALKGDKRSFRVSTNKNNFFEGEKIIFEGELYNDNYELVNTPDVNLLLKNEYDESFPFVMNKTSNAYTLSTSSLPLGNYSYIATTRFTGKELSANGAFSINTQQLEAIHTQANHTLLKSLASKTSGKFYTPDFMENLANDILTNENIKPILYENYKTQPIINLVALFFVIMFLLSIEWFFRKWLGAY